MSFFSQMSAAFDQSAAFVGRPFVYKGDTYIGIVNFLNTSEVIDYGGFQSHLSATIAINCNLMPQPAKGERLTIDGVDRRVVNVTNNNGVSWHIGLEDVSR